MKILLPNAKELNTNQDAQPTDQAASVSQPVLQQLLTYSPADLAGFYKIRPEKAQLEYDRFQRIAQSSASVYPALHLYDGLMYRYMRRREWTDEEQTYWQERVRIATGLYGLIVPLTLIAPHRLDFQGRIEIEGGSLKHYWRSFYDQEVADSQEILSLLSSEFEQAFSPRVQARMTRVVFMEEKDGQLKTHSTISKKGRGRLVSLLATQQITCVDAVRGLVVDDFVYQETASSEKTLVFVRKV